MKKNHQPYIKWYSSDFLAGVRGLSASQIGIYIILINEMYERCEPLPLNYKRLAWQCGCTKTTFKKGLDILIEEEKIIMKDGGLWNNRVEKEFKNRQKRSATGSDNANARWKKANEINNGVMPTVCKTDATAMLIPEARNQKPDKKKIQKEIIEKDFDEFWILCLRKDAKDRGLKNYIKARKDADKETILSAMKAYSKSCEEKGTERDYIKVPANWLSDGMYKDQLEMNGHDYLNAKDGEWKARIKAYKRNGNWHDEWGFKPDENGNDVPKAILRENNFQTLTNNGSE